MNRGTLIRWVAVGWTALYTVTAVVFVSGYALDDPGGWRGVTIVVGWLVPLVLLTAVTARWPQRVVRPFTVAVMMTVLLEAAALASRSGWAGLENQLGPVRAVAVFTLAAPLAVLGLRRTDVAARLLLVLGVATSVLSVSPAPGSAPMRVAGVCATLSGLLYLLSNLGRRPVRSRRFSA